jgi:hypothetical protein
MDNASGASAVDRIPFGVGPWLQRLASRPWELARAHGLNPWVFVAMAGFGHALQALVFLPWFQGHAWQLSFLILLRLMALVVPAYIFLRGRGVAPAFSLSVAAMFVLNTTWQVCYYVYA